MHSHGLTKDGYERHFGINHLAHFYLFLLLKELLLKSSTPSFHSRVISVSSSIHTMGPALVGDWNLENREGGYDPFAAYANSKVCNIWMANEIERRYADQGLHSISVHPGGIRTGFEAMQDPQAKVVIEQVISQSEYIQKAFKSIEQGAASIVLAAVGKEYEGEGGYVVFAVTSPRCWMCC